MKAVLYIIAILVSLVGSFFIYDNTKKVKVQKEEFVELTNQKARIAKSIKKEQQEVDRKSVEAKELNTLVAEVNAQVEAASSKKKALQKTLTGYEEESKEIEEKLAEYESAIEEITSMLATVDMQDATEIPDQIEALKVEIKEKEEKLESIDAIVAGLSEKLEGAKLDEQKVQSRLSEIKENLRRNAMRGTVTAVNSNWGFVIINRGSSNSNLKENTPLLVTRGGNYIGTVNVSKLESSQSICEVPEDSSYSIQAGDSVILKNTVAQ